MPLRERGTAKGIFFSGAYASAALTTFTVNLLLPVMSWRTILLVFGCVGFVWVIAWKRWFRDEPTDHPAANEAERALILADRAPVVAQPRGWAYWRGLLRQRNVLLLCLSYMPNCATFYFCITWLPSYLRQHHGFESTQLGIVASLPLALSIATQFLGGFWSDKIAGRFGLRAGRRTPGIVGYGGAALFLLAATLTSNPKAAAVLFALTVATCMLTTAASWSTCVDIGREHSATVSATMNTSGQIAAIAMPLVVGYSLKWFDNWNAPFYFLAGLFVMGAVCWIFIDPKKPVFAAEPA
jgi:nitrate/nitrite transporter NarK